MATGKVTKRAVEAVPLPETGKRSHLWDDTLKGFGVMVTDRGVRSYIVQYRVGGRGNPTRRVTIGKHGSPWTAERARHRAAEILEQVRRRVDPFDAERAAVADASEAKRRAADARVVAERLGFSTFADRFIEKYAKVQQPRTWRDTEGALRRDLKPHFGETPLPSITSADVVELLDKFTIAAPPLRSEPIRCCAAYSAMPSTRRSGTCLRPRHLCWGSSRRQRSSVATARSPMTSCAWSG